MPAILDANVTFERARKVFLVKRSPCIEFIKEEVTDISTGNGKYVGVIKDWAKTDNKTLKFKCFDVREKNTCSCAIRNYIKKNSLDWTMTYERGTYNIYITRS